MHIMQAHVCLFEVKFDFCSQCCDVDTLWTSCPRLTDQVERRINTLIWRCQELRFCQVFQKDILCNLSPWGVYYSAGTGDMSESGFDCLSHNFPDQRAETKCLTRSFVPALRQPVLHWTSLSYRSRRIVRYMLKQTSNKSQKGGEKKVRWVLFHTHLQKSTGHEGSFHGWCLGDPMSYSLPSIILFVTHL